MLRDGKLLGLKFRRQHPIHKFIVDFYCHEKKLVIESDGRSHDDVGSTLADEERDKWLGRNGFDVLRFSNKEVYADIDQVLWEIEDHLIK